MPKVTEAHMEARRQQIIDAACACFSRNGFHQTTMQDICREADLSPGAVYRYFASKEEIIETSCLAGAQITNEAFEAAKAKEETLQIFDELAEVFFGMLGDPEYINSMRVDVQLWGEALRSPNVRQLFNASTGLVMQHLEDIVMAAQAKGDIDPNLSPRAAAHVFMSFYHGLELQKVMDPELDVLKYTEAVNSLYSGNFWTGAARF